MMREVNKQTHIQHFNQSNNYYLFSSLYYPALARYCTDIVVVDSRVDSLCSNTSLHHTPLFIAPSASFFTFCCSRPIICIY